MFYSRIIKTMQAFYDKSPVNLSSRVPERISDVLKSRAINTEMFKDEHSVSFHELMGNHTYILLPRFAATLRAKDAKED